MTVGRKFSASSLPRYYIKMVRRFSGLVPDNTDIPNVASYAISANWLNGFATYSELRYKILPILDKYGIPRSVAYAFMAMIQHAYKEAVAKKDTKPEVLLDHMINILTGSSVQARYWGDKLDDVFNAIADMFKVLGLSTTLAPGV